MTNLELPNSRNAGFIELLTKGAFSRKSPHASEWRLTFNTCDVTGELASKASALLNSAVASEPPGSGLKSGATCKTFNAPAAQHRQPETQYCVESGMCKRRKPACAVGFRLELSEMPLARWAASPNREHTDLGLQNLDLASETFNNKIFLMNLDDVEFQSGRLTV